MGSVISYEKCSQCGGVYSIDYYYRTGEEYRFCQRCGKVHNHAIVRDENSNFCYDENGKEYELEVMQGNAPSIVELSREALYNTSDSNTDKFTVKLSGNTSWSVSGYNGNNIAYQYCPKNKNGKKNYWAYRCDNKYG